MSLDEIDLQHTPAEDAELFDRIREWARLCDESEKCEKAGDFDAAHKLDDQAYHYYPRISECGPPKTLAGVLALLELEDTGSGGEPGLMNAIAALREIAGIPLTKPRWSDPFALGGRQDAPSPLSTLARERQEVVARWRQAPEGGYPEAEAAVISSQQRMVERRINLAPPASLADVAIKLRTVIETVEAGFDLADDDMDALRQCLAFAETGA